MGNIQAGLDLQRHPDVVPTPQQNSKWDPNYGFASQREPKVMVATPEELHSAKIPQDRRDYCAHHLIEYRRCHRDNFPWVASNCGHEKHVYLNCQYEEFVDRMKDYERERRLMEREKRKAEAA